MAISPISQLTHTSQARLGSVTHLELSYEVQFNYIVDRCLIILIRVIYPFLQICLTDIYTYLRLPINVLYYIVGANISLNVFYLSNRTQDITKFSVKDLSQYPSQTLNGRIFRYP